MSLNAILGVACIVSFCLPVTVICYNRFYKHRSLTALLVYYIFAIVDNLMSQGWIPVTSSFSKNFSIFNNYIDVPLMLTTLFFFCPSRQRQQRVHLLTVSFIAYELIVTAFHGFNTTAVVYIMAPGILIVLGYSFYLFIRQVKFSIVHGKNQGRTVMLASIFFLYASFSLIFYFYYIMKTPHKADTVMLYYIASTIAAIMMGIGLHMMRKRMKELATIQTTRRELALFFGQSV